MTDINDTGKVIGDDTDHTPTPVLLSRIEVQSGDILDTIDVLQGRNLDGYYGDSPSQAIASRLGEAANLLKEFLKTIEALEDDVQGLDYSL